MYGPVKRPRQFTAWALNISMAAIQTPMASMNRMSHQKRGRGGEASKVLPTRRLQAYSAMAAKKYSGSLRLAGDVGSTWVHHSARATVPISRPMMTTTRVPVTRCRYSSSNKGMISSRVPTQGLATPARRAWSALMRIWSWLSCPSTPAGMLIRRGIWA
ncbi:hypothetical protein D3C78_1203590 [compost metagenome]